MLRFCRPVKAQRAWQVVTTVGRFFTMVRAVPVESNSWRDSIDDEDSLVCMDCGDYATMSRDELSRKRQPAEVNYDRIEQWLNNKRIVTKNDESVCWICLR